MIDRFRFSQFSAGCSGYFFGGDSKTSSSSSSQTNNYTDQSDNRQDNRTDQSVKDAYNTTSTDQSDNRQDNRQDNRVTTTNTTTNTDQSDKRQDNRQDNRVITNYSVDAELTARAYENLATAQKAQATAFEQSIAAQRAITDAANRTAADAVARTTATLQQASSDQLTATRLAIEGVTGSTSEAIRAVGLQAQDSNRNLAGVSTDAMATVERVNTTSLGAQRDTTKDAFSLAAELFDRSLGALTDQTSKDLSFAGGFLGNVFDQQKTADTQNLEKIVDAAKVVTVVGLLAWGLTRIGRKAA